MLHISVLIPNAFKLLFLYFSGLVFSKVCQFVNFLLKQLLHLILFPFYFLKLCSHLYYFLFSLNFFGLFPCPLTFQIRILSQDFELFLWLYKYLRQKFLFKYHLSTTKYLIDGILLLFIFLNTSFFFYCIIAYLLLH